MQLHATVFIVDGDQAARESLVAVVGSMGLPAEAYESAESMLAAFDADRTGCVLIDLRLPGISGLELMEQLIARRAPLGVVMFSAHGDVRVAVRAMKNGAVDVLQKPYALEELRESVLRAVEVGAARSTNAVSPSLAALNTLSASEHQVLELTVRGMANKNIASRLGMSLRTVHIRRGALMRKLDVKNRSELIRLAVQLDLQKTGETSALTSFGVAHGGMEQAQRAFRNGAPDA